MRLKHVSAAFAKHSRMYVLVLRLVEASRIVLIGDCWWSFMDVQNVNGDSAVGSSRKYARNSSLSSNLLTVWVSGKVTTVLRDSVGLADRARLGDVLEGAFRLLDEHLARSDNQFLVRVRADRLDDKVETGEQSGAAVQHLPAGFSRFASPAFRTSSL